MSRDTRWGRSYQDGDLVLTVLNGANCIVLAAKHSGDRRHDFVVLQAKKSETQPDTHWHVTAEPDNGRSGYFIGLVVGHLDLDQMLRVGHGIDIEKPRIMLGDIEIEITLPEDT